MRPENSKVKCFRKEVYLKNKILVAGARLFNVGVKTFRENSQSLIRGKKGFIHFQFQTVLKETKRVRAQRRARNIPKKNANMEDIH